MFRIAWISISLVGSTVFAASPDINVDFAIDLRDVAALFVAFGSDSPSSPADLDEDGFVGLLDFGSLHAELTGPLPCEGLDETAVRYSQLLWIDHDQAACCLSPSTNRAP